jgi:hypothetical protein
MLERRGRASATPETCFPGGEDREKARIFTEKEVRRFDHTPLEAFKILVFP